MLALATVVTAGSMYVTARAAAQQDGAEFGAAVATPEVAGDVGVPDVQAALDQLDAALDKTQILRNEQSHVILDENGGFTGRVSSLQNSDGEKIPAANLIVRLAQHGTVIGSTTTDTNGRFSFTGLPEGVVAVWAEGENTLMLFSVVLFAKDSAIPENAGLQTTPLELDLDSALSSGVDIATVKELMSPYLNVAAPRFADGITAGDQEFNYGSGEASTTVENHRVRLLNDGTLRGEIGLMDERTGRFREVLDLTIHFVRNGTKVASSEVSNDGGFIVSGLAPGIHSVVVAGQDGVLVTAVDVVGTTYEDNQVRNAGLGDYTPVNTVAGSLILAGSFSGSPSGSANAGALAGSSSGSSGSGAGDLGTGTPVASSGGGGTCGGGTGGGGTGGGGTGGGGTGGGGTGGGGGGLGALVAGGLAGAAGYLAGQNNNGTPASPGL